MLVQTYTPEQLSRAEKMFALFSAMPAEKQNVVAMIANAFMEGMKAQEQLEATNAPTARN